MTHLVLISLITTAFSTTVIKQSNTLLNRFIHTFSTPSLIVNLVSSNNERIQCSKTVCVCVSTSLRWMESKTVSATFNIVHSGPRTADNNACLPTTVIVVVKALWFQIWQTKRKTTRQPTKTTAWRKGILGMRWKHYVSFFLICFPHFSSPIHSPNPNTFQITTMHLSRLRNICESNETAKLDLILSLLLN